MHWPCRVCVPLRWITSNYNLQWKVICLCSSAQLSVWPQVTAKHRLCSDWTNCVIKRRIKALCSIIRCPCFAIKVPFPSEEAIVVKEFLKFHCSAVEINYNIKIRVAAREPHRLRNPSNINIHSRSVQCIRPCEIFSSEIQIEILVP